MGSLVFIEEEIKMEYQLKEIVKKEDKKVIATDILANLPDWFGLPESTKNYILEGQDLPFIAAFKGEEAIGYIVLKASSKDCADIFVMGIKQAYHRKGLGRKLYEAYEELARELGYTYSQVKTVQTGHYEVYDRTNAFYQAMGFKELECFLTLWDEWNPCQVYVKYIG